MRWARAPLAPSRCCAPSRRSGADRRFHEPAIRTMPSWRPFRQDRTVRRDVVSARELKAKIFESGSDWNITVERATGIEPAYSAWECELGYGLPDQWHLRVLHGCGPVVVAGDRTSDRARPSFDLSFRLRSWANLRWGGPVLKRTQPRAFKTRRSILDRQLDAE